MEEFKAKQKKIRKKLISISIGVFCFFLIYAIVGAAIVILKQDAAFSNNGGATWIIDGTDFSSIGDALASGGMAFIYGVIIIVMLTFYISVGLDGVALIWIIYGIIYLIKYKSLKKKLNIGGNTK